MRHLKSTITLFVLLITTTITRAQDDSPAAMMARIEAAQSPDRGGYDGLTLAELMQKFRLPSVSIAIIKDYKIHFAKAYGIADVETGQLADTATLFQAGSISKPIFAMLVLKLVQEGKLSLDNNINSYLKSWQVPDSGRTAPVTMRSLLSHTSGADDGFGFPGYNPGEPFPTLAQVVNGQKPSNTGIVPFKRIPYTGFKYSGGGFAIAQLAIEDLMKRPMAELADEKFFKPMGLKNITYQQPLPANFMMKAARGHTGGGKRQPAPWHDYPEQSAAGLWSTPSDLARLVIELQKAVNGSKNDILAQATARELLTPTGVGGHAQGFVIERRGEGWYFSHSGSNWNFRADMIGHMRKGYGLIIMANSENGWGVITELESRIIAAYNWDALAKPIPR
jgi:CubicO group peptidase (beta-lactamase class C family)